MAVTRVVYIIYPAKAHCWFNTRAKCLILVSIPAIVGLLYAFPGLDPCCYRFYVFSSYTYAYVGPEAQVQVMFSSTSCAIFVIVNTTCYTWVIFGIRRQIRRIKSAGNQGRTGSANANKEKRVRLKAELSGKLKCNSLLSDSHTEGTLTNYIHQVFSGSNPNQVVDMQLCYISCLHNSNTIIWQL